jgi:aldehyde:ferredoxin oxidoreductase
VRCKKIAKIDQPDTPYKVDPAYGGPEYETMAAFGSDCGNGDMKAICKANERCNAYGLDTISMGMVIGFAMECFEKGYLTTKDTGGIDLKFGNADAMLKCVELTAKREGFGNFLAEGTLRMSKKIGKDSKDFAIQTKGLETGMHDPRTKVGLGLGYMVNPHGGDHCCGMRDMVVADDVMLTPFHALGRLTPVPVMDIGPKKVGYFHITHCFNIIEDAMVTCTIVPIPYQLKADILTAITGWDTGIGELVTIGERILTVFRLFNIREGFTDADDVLPERFFQPKTDGALVNMHLKPDDFDKAKRYYYALMGWDNKGVPLPAKVEDLEIK